jgi:HisJ family histidinol phosphate phosphatase
MSDHGPIKPEFMTREEFVYNWLERQMAYEEFLEIYLPDCKKTKEKYKNLINFYIGIEIEYLHPFHDYYVKLREKLDYMNLAVHFYYHNGKITNSFDDVTYENVYSYALNAKIAMETGLFNILVHPDVYMYRYRSVDGKATFDSECERTARLIIENAIKNNVYLEINVGGIFKVTSNNETVGKFAYPREEFWKIVSEYPEAKVVIGVDAHKPKHLRAEEIKMAYEFAKKHNIIVLEKVETIG